MTAMTGANAKRLREIWIWQAPLRPVATGLVILVSVVIAAILHPRFGAMAFIPLPLAIAGLLHWIIYGWVARRIARLRKARQMAGGKIADALIVKGIVQSPGIVILSAAEIHLIPITGSPVALPPKHLSRDERAPLVRWHVLSLENKVLAHGPRRIPPRLRRVE